MKFKNILTREELRNIKAGSGLGGCYMECCTVVSGGSDFCSGAGTSTPTSNEGGSFEDCSSNEQCQSDYIANQGGDPCGPSQYVSALCYN